MTVYLAKVWKKNGEYTVVKVFKSELNALNWVSKSQDRTYTKIEVE